MDKHEILTFCTDIRQKLKKKTQERREYSTCLKRICNSRVFGSAWWYRLVPYIDGVLENNGRWTERALNESVMDMQDPNRKVDYFDAISIILL
jgi:hypothetical protein